MPPTMLVCSACLVLCLLGPVSAGRLRVPKVYNAIISSSDNLSPSRAYPLIQPVLHETAVGYPLSPYIYQNHPIVHPLQRYDADAGEMRQESKTVEQEVPKPSEAPASKAADSNSSAKAEPDKENPLKLNEFGLPPSLIPIQQFPQPKLTYQYDPYNAYNPFFSDPYNVLLPYNNPYPTTYQYQSPFTPNPFNPYVVPNSLFSPTQQQGDPNQNQNQPWQPQNPSETPQKDQNNQEVQPQFPPQGFGPPFGFPQGFPQGRPQIIPQIPLQNAPQSPNPTQAGIHSTQSEIAPSPVPSKQPVAGSSPWTQGPSLQTPQGSPTTLNIKNNQNRNPNIPDVPPPPLPQGGLKYDTTSPPTNQPA